MKAPYLYSLAVWRRVVSCPNRMGKCSAVWGTMPKAEATLLSERADSGLFGGGASYSVFIWFLSSGNLSESI